MLQIDYQNKWKPTLYYCALYAVAVWVFLHKFEWYVLDPTCISWLMGPETDCITDFTTWEYYRYATATHQSGVFYNYSWPQTVGVGNTSIVPLLAVPFKCIQQYLPENFQYFGWFFLMCYLLQTYFANRLLKILGLPIGMLRFSGVLCLTLAPALLFRAAHVSLCAHWIILGCLCFYFEQELSFTKKILSAVLMSSVAALTHPYLILFPLAIFSALALRDFKFNIRSAFQSLLLVFIPPIFCYWCFYVTGMFSLGKGESSSGGFGFYAANLNTFFNNIGYTNLKLLSFTNHLSGQYEGFAYLGGGVLLLWLFLLSQPKFLLHSFSAFCKKNYPLILVTIALSVYATGFAFYFNDTFLYEKRFSDEHRLTLSVFRSSGRFIWLAHYLLIAAPFVLLHRIQWLKAKPNMLLVLTFFALVLQFFDIAPLYAKHTFKENFKPPIGYEFYEEITANTPIVYTFPAYDRSMEVFDDVHYLLHTGAKYRTKITAGHLPRPTLMQQYPVTGVLRKMTETNTWLLEKNAVLMVGKRNGFLFAGLLQNQIGVQSAVIGDCIIIFDSSNRKIASIVSRHKLQQPQFNLISLDQFLEKYPNHYWVMTIKDEGSEGLSKQIKDYFSNKGSIISGLMYRESYIGIFKKGAVLFEQKNEAHSNFDTTLISENDKRKHTISLASASAKEEKSMSSVLIDGKEVSPDFRGMNVVILDQNFNVVATKNFDTFLSSFAESEH